MRVRHNLILERIRRALANNNCTILIDQKIPDSPGRLRPDIAIIRGSEICIVDVIIPFENTPNSFVSARSEKRLKYADLVSWAQSKFDKVSFGVFIVGSLGSWDPDNQFVLRMLRIGANYAKLFKRLCCIDALKGSLEIWRSFCSVS